MEPILLIIGQAKGFASLDSFWRLLDSYKQAEGTV